MLCLRCACVLSSRPVCDGTLLTQCQKVHDDFMLVRLGSAFYMMLFLGFLGACIGSVTPRCILCCNGPMVLGVRNLCNFQAESLNNNVDSAGLLQAVHMKLCQETVET
jgi:hypothetical protein